MKAKRVFYEGHVQGVGFRYGVKRIAGGFEVIGWVRNLSDGRVEVLAASWEPDEIDEFLIEIVESDLGGGIQDAVIEECAPPADLVGFSIR